MAVKGTALLLLPLLQGASADWTTTIKTKLVVPNTLAPVVDYVTPTPGSTSSLMTWPAASSSFDHARSHEEQLTSVVTVPDGSSPTIHFSPVISTTSATEPGDPTSSTEDAASSVTSSTNIIPSGPTGQNTPTQPSPTPVVPGSTGSNPSSSVGASTESTASGASSAPVVSASSPTGASSSTQSGSTNIIPSSTGQNSPSTQISSMPTAPGSTESGSGPSSSAGSSSSPNPASETPPLSGDTSSDAASSTLSSQQSTSTSSGLINSQTITSGNPMSSVAPPDQLISASLSSAPDLESLSADATGSDSAIGDYAPTEAPSSEPWGASPTSDPSGTITDGPTPTSTSTDSEESNVAVLLRNSYNNIEDLKKDPKSYKQHIKDITDQTEDYLSKTNFDSSKSPCAGSKSKRADLFSAVKDLASQAAGATVDNAKGIAGAAISCVKPIASEIEDVIPPEAEDVTDEIQSEVEIGTEYLDELGEIVTDMEEKTNDENDDDDDEDDDDDNSSSESDSSTSSTSTSTSCTSSTTFSDCTWSTIVSSTPGSGSASMSSTSTEICKTTTACQASPSTFSTITTVAACPRITTRVSAPAPVYITPSGYTGSATPGSGGSGPLSSSVSATTPPKPASSSATTSGTSSSSRPAPGSAGSSTTPPPSATTPGGASCQALYHVAQKDDYAYCQFDCDAYTGKYPVASSTPGMSNYEPCPYSKPPSTTWGPSNAGTFTTTATDGIVYYCGDSGYQDHGLNDAKSCVTPMSSMTVIPSIHSAWSVSAVSEASATQASAMSAIAAAARPTDQLYIAYDDQMGSWDVYWKIFNVAMDDTDPEWCDMDPLGASEASGSISVKDVPNPPSIDFSDDASVVSDSFKDCAYDADSARLECPDVSTKCKTDMEESMGTKTCHGTFRMTKYVPKVWCAWGDPDTPE
ncbi:hypothetical protein ASPSYDRAFT_36666 [Aspergillus sydowii CBS 593.65]|uniref:Ig-like domain-containing protein n=1 Tax=Aspergillus sydowii CBS 593.65 TaxID=1036612 RepID=A0A1L9T0W8_9EURO|nr:uncharacterized protein ASPSYDRAFT_36666 [Aspergillus sydowii CBS 593.65]OJJ53112.1 hypothetical protein ASPSYDRAFT_36666 [Aspergillus sydowii CBS 593.65]